MTEKIMACAIRRQKETATRCFVLWLFLFLCSHNRDGGVGSVVVAAAEEGQQRPDTCTSSQSQDGEQAKDRQEEDVDNDDDDEEAKEGLRMLHGYPRELYNDNLPLRPENLPPVRVYQNWTNGTIDVMAPVSSSSSADGGGDGDGDNKAAYHHHHRALKTVNVSRGYIRQAGQGDFWSQLNYLPQIATREEIEAMMSIIRDPDIGQFELDNEPDSVDGFPSQEFFLDNDSIRGGLGGKPTVESAEDVENRRRAREAMNKIAQPILRERLTPYVHTQFPDMCNSTTKDGRRRICTPCYSLIRRYLHGERQSHAPHRDGHAIVTAVVSLTDYGPDYRGGLFVAASYGHPYYLALSKGDAAVHHSDLLHGVKVYPGDKKTDDGQPTAERWSWIIWYKDSENCQEETDMHWFPECAAAGNPTCEYLHSTNQGRNKYLSDAEQSQQGMHWSKKAAAHGHPTACVKLGRAYLGRLQSDALRETNRTKARILFERAVRASNEPDAHYDLASMLLEEIYADHDVAAVHGAKMDQVIAHLEAAAHGGHPFAMFNLGIAHLYGYGSYYLTKHRPTDPDIAGDWFEASGLPEGFAARAMHFNAIGQTKLAEQYQRSADSLGFGTPLRLAARSQSGFCGVGGISLNLLWPPTMHNNVPPQF